MTLLATEFLLAASFCMCCRKASFASAILDSWANRHRASRLSLCRSWLSCQLPQAATSKATQRRCSPWHCPRCGTGMVISTPAFVNRDIDAVCLFGLIVEHRHSLRPATRVLHVFPPVCSKCPQSTFMPLGIAARMPPSVANLPQLRITNTPIGLAAFGHRVKQEASKPHKRPPQTPAASF